MGNHGERNTFARRLFDSFAPTSIGHADRSVSTLGCALAAPALVFASLFLEWMAPDLGLLAVFDATAERAGTPIAPVDLLFNQGVSGATNVPLIVRVLLGSIYVAVMLAAIVPQALYRAPQEHGFPRPDAGEATAHSIWPLTLGALAFMILVIAASGVSFPHRAAGFWVFVGGCVAWWVAMRNIQVAVRRLQRAGLAKPGLGFSRETSKRIAS